MRTTEFFRILSNGSTAQAEMLALLEAGDRTAMDLHRAGMERRLGPDPLASGACEWPRELAEPHVVLEIPATAPLTGWRAWGIQGTHLLAPFLSATLSSDRQPLDKRGPGTQWKPGVNKCSTVHCAKARPARKGRPSQPHPLSRCRCGIRVVQSRTVLEAYIAANGAHSATPLATAQVAVWGRVAGYAPGYEADCDWPYTLRAQYAKIVGPLEIAASLEPRQAALARRYGVEVLVA